MCLTTGKIRRSRKKTMLWLWKKYGSSLSIKNKKVLNKSIITQTQKNLHVTCSKYRKRSKQINVSSEKNAPNMQVCIMDSENKGEGNVKGLHGLVPPVELFISVRALGITLGLVVRNSVRLLLNNYPGRGPGVMLGYISSRGGEQYILIVVKELSFLLAWRIFNWLLTATSSQAAGSSQEDWLNTKIALFLCVSNLSGRNNLKSIERASTLLSYVNKFWMVLRPSRRVDL